jgi:hypothetical protein
MKQSILRLRDGKIISAITFSHRQDIDDFMKENMYYQMENPFNGTFDFHDLLEQNFFFNNDTYKDFIIAHMKGDYYRYARYTDHI